MAQTSPAHLQGSAPVQDGLLAVRIDRERLHSLGGRDVLRDVRRCVPVGVREVVGISDRGLPHLDVALFGGGGVFRIAGELLLRGIRFERGETDESEEHGGREGGREGGRGERRKICIIFGGVLEHATNRVGGCGGSDLTIGAIQTIQKEEPVP